MLPRSRDFFVRDPPSPTFVLGSIPRNGGVIMAQWEVTREKLELFPHPNPAVERLELGRAGQYQVVVGKGTFVDGSTIIFVPEKSVLPDQIADEGDRRKYLVGPQKNRVKAIQLQKE